eukprot:TRINITY_DN67653_c8_g4_i1.p1 TRINITY_DN67653_c8_g4~~TRINITY_DN67653_c8_g4_i1.p1  ORF type:complete len:982 (-),score=120.87 TRINITY_DN67653_c8_g4_i1:498-3383(-)
MSNGGQYSNGDSDSHNRMLTSNLLVHEEGIQEDLQVKPHSRERQNLINQKQRDSVPLIKALEAEYALRFSDAFDVSRLLSLANLRLPPTQLYNPQDQPQFDATAELWRRLEELKNKSVEPFTTNLGKSSTIAKTLMQEMRRSQLDDSQVSILPLDSFQVLERFLALPDVRACLAPIDSKIDALLKEVVEVEIPQGTEDVRLAVQDDDIQMAEEQLKIREDLVDLIHEKYAAIKAHVAKLLPFKDLTHLDRRAKLVTRQLKEEKRQLKERTRLDLANLSDEQERVKNLHQHRIKQYATCVAACDKVIQENEDEQKRLWDEIHTAEQHLAFLGEQRIREIQRRIDARHEEEVRKAEHDQYMRAIADHMKLLHATIYNCEIFMENCDRVENIVTSTVGCLGDAFNDAKKEIEEIELATHKEYYEYFVAHHKIVPLLITFNEGNLEHIYSSMSRESYKFTFLYRERRAENEQDIALLIRDAQQQYIRFLPTLNALRAKGVDVTDPVFDDSLLSETMRERRYALKQFRRAFADMGEADIDEMKKLTEELDISSQPTETRREELYFSLTNPLATPRQLESQGGGMESNRPQRQASKGAALSENLAPKEALKSASQIKQQSRQRQEAAAPPEAGLDIAAIAPIQQATTAVSSAPPPRVNDVYSPSPLSSSQPPKSRTAVSQLASVESPAATTAAGSYRAYNSAAVGYSSGNEQVSPRSDYSSSPPERRRRKEGNDRVRSPVRNAGGVTATGSPMSEDARGRKRFSSYGGSVSGVQPGYDSGSGRGGGWASDTSGYDGSDVDENTVVRNSRDVNRGSPRRTVSPLRTEYAPSNPVVASRSSLTTRTDDTIRKPTAASAGQVIRGRKGSPLRPNSTELMDVHVSNIPKNRGEPGYIAPRQEKRVITPLSSSPRAAATTSAQQASSVKEELGIVQRELEREMAAAAESARMARPPHNQHQQRAYNRRLPGM